MRPEYEFAVSLGAVEKYTFKEHHNTMVSVKSGEKAYTFSKENCMCECDFASTLKLPCRHAMFYRKRVSMLPVIPVTYLDSRWRVKVPDSTVDLLNQIARELADLPMRAFEAEIEFLERYYREVRRGISHDDVLTNNEEGHTPENTSASQNIDEPGPQPGHQPVSEPSKEPGDQPVTQPGDKTVCQHGREIIPQGGDQPRDEPAEHPGYPPVSTTGEQCVSKPGDQPENQQGVQPGSQPGLQLGDQPGNEPVIKSGNEPVCPNGDKKQDGGITLKLNKRVRRSGRPSVPQVQKAKIRSAARRKFNMRLEKGGELAFDDVAVVASVVEEKTRSLSELNDILTIFPVQYEEAYRIVLKVGTDKAPITAASVSFILPQALVRRALDTLYKLPMPIPSQSDEDPPFVKISGLGNFTLFQLDAMQKIWTIKTECEKGSALLHWLDERCGKQQGYKTTKERVSGGHPYEIVNAELHRTLDYTYLYQLGPRQWIKASLFEALGTVWATQIDVSMIMMPEFKLNKKTKKVKLPDNLVRKIRTTKTQHIFLPINFERNHWTSVIIKTNTKSIFVYDPLGNSDYVDFLKKISSRLKQEKEFKLFG